MYKTFTGRILAGVIKDLGIVEMIDQLLKVSPDEKITTGEAVAGMIINGLGFTDRPMTLTPQFFENCPLEVLFRPGIQAENFNRFKLGRALEEIFEFGCDALFSNIAKVVCKKEGIDTTFVHLDSTSFSLTGQYTEDIDDNKLNDTDRTAITITHGYSKDHRPDLKQVVLELLVSRDGGIPLLCMAWDGNTSDNEIFNNRSKALVEGLKSSPSPTHLIADSKLYSKENAENLKDLPFITRIPDTISLVKETICTAQSKTEAWITHSEKRRYQEFEIVHYEIPQRWIVVYSDSAYKRSTETVKKKVKKEKEEIQKEIIHLHAARFECKEDAKREVYQKTKKWKYHQLDTIEFKEHDYELFSSV